MILSGILTALLFVASATAASSPVQTNTMIETDSFAFGIGADGRVSSFLDKKTGTDYFDLAAPAPFASVRTDAGTFPATSAAYKDGELEVLFDAAGGRARFRVTPEHRRITFEVVSFTCENALELTFVRIPLTLKGSLADPFGVSPLALALNTNCHQIPGFSSGLTGFIACKRFGFAGARGAIVASPPAELRDALKDAVKSAPELVSSSLGGPWALDVPINQGSYLIAMDEDVTEQNVGKWIEAARAAGASQIDLHGGHAFRWGDFEPNKDVYPRGRESLKAVVDAIHEAGMAAGLHSYAFFMSKDTPWVTPVPDARLATDASFTLADDIAEDASDITVAETTETMSAITGFQVRNSATLRLDDELITYAEVRKEAPFGFKGCVRGAYGTRATRHPQGTKALHLKECFGLFVPQGDSTLFTEVAARTADLYNACGFDMLYLDALDGSDIVEGPANAWYYEALFVNELLRRLQKPAVMEMSTFSHHLWRARSRMQAWDCAARSVKDFVDCHVANNVQWKAAFLPTHLGWWGSFGWTGVQPERTLPDDMEYVCAKALATDSSLSYIVGFTPELLKKTNSQRLATIAQRYEKIRQAGTVSESLKARLATPGQDFTLNVADDDSATFRPTTYAKHYATAGTESGRVTVNNPHAAQPLRLRIEAPLAPAAYDAPESTVLADFADKGEFGKVETQEGVTATLTAGGQESAATLSVQNSNVPPYRAWSAFRKDFAAPVDFKNKGLGLWVVGDGQGEVLNVQLSCPAHFAGGISDHYIRIDFTGRRYFELVEPESETLGDYEWAHTRRLSDMLSNPVGITRFLYPMYHIWVDYAHIGSLTLGINNVPAGKSVQVGLGPIKAVALHEKKLVNPRVTLGGNTLAFPVELASGSYLEFLAQDDCKVYDARGEYVCSVVPGGPIPEVATGDNVIEFGCDSKAGASVRAGLTVVLYGEPLRP